MILYQLRKEEKKEEKGAPRPSQPQQLLQPQQRRILPRIPELNRRRYQPEETSQQQISNNDIGYQNNLYREMMANHNMNSECFQHQHSAFQNMVPNERTKQRSTFQRSRYNESCNNHKSTPSVQNFRQEPQQRHQPLPQPSQLLNQFNLYQQQGSMRNQQRQWQEPQNQGPAYSEGYDPFNSYQQEQGFRRNQ